MSEDGTSALKLLCRDIATLAACVELGFLSDPGYALPSLSPHFLARILPRILARAALVGVEVEALTGDQEQFMAALAQQIVIARPAGVHAVTNEPQSEDRT